MFPSLPPSSIPFCSFFLPISLSLSSSVRFLLLLPFPRLFFHGFLSFFLVFPPILYSFLRTPYLSYSSPPPYPFYSHPHPYLLHPVIKLPYSIFHPPHPPSPQKIAYGSSMYFFSFSFFRGPVSPLEVRGHCRLYDPPGRW